MHHEMHYVMRHVMHYARRQAHGPPPRLQPCVLEAALTTHQPHTRHLPTTCPPCAFHGGQVFGRVVGGLDTLTKIEKVPTDKEDKPTTEQVHYILHYTVHSIVHYITSR